MGNLRNEPQGPGLKASKQSKCQNPASQPRSPPTPSEAGLFLWEGPPLKKLHDYRQHAAECREMARVASASHRDQLIQMAETWEGLAAARKRKMEREGKTEEDYPDAS